MTRTFAHGRIELVLGNIVDQHVDAIVNAANTSLLGGGGVDGAIHRAAGPDLLEACKTLPTDPAGQRCPTGEVRSTAAFDLHARWVIHAVGPFYNERYAEKAERSLASAHRAALEAAARLGAQSVAFPAISTGAYRYPAPEAARVAMRETTAFLTQPSSVTLVRFVLFSPSLLATYSSALDLVAPPGA